MAYDKIDQTTTPELRKIFRKQRKLFIKKFGREPTPNDPVFFNSESTGSEPESLDGTEVSIHILKAMEETDLPMSYRYVFESRGLAPPTKNAIKRRPERYQEWLEAIHAWEELEDYIVYDEALDLLKKEREESGDKTPVFPSHIVQKISEIDPEASTIFAVCDIPSNPEKWEAYNEEFLKYGFDEADDFTHYSNPYEKVYSNRADWNWDKDLSTWRPEHIHLLSEAILTTLNMMDEDSEKDSGHDSQTYLVDVAPAFVWSPQEIDPVVWKTTPFMTACKAMRFFSQYALSEEELSKVFPAKQLWLFDRGCFHALEDVLGLEIVYELKEVTEPLRSEDWLVLARLSRYRDRGKFTVGFVWNVFAKSNIDRVMQYLSGVDGSEVDTSNFTPVPIIGQAVKEGVVPPDESGSLLAALIDFMQQTITLKIKRGIHSKKVKKRLEKKLGYVPEYTVMSLRTVEADEGAKKGTEGRKLMYRQLVREHYKNVCVGPKGRRRKLVLIDAYERGPEDALLIPTKKSKRIIR